MNILVIGESCTDVYRYGECSRLCPEAPVPVIKVSNRNVSYNPGMAMNVYTNIRALSDLDKTEVSLMTNKNWESVNKVRYVDERTNYIILRADYNDEQIPHCDDLRQIDFSQFEVVVISDYNKGFLAEEDIEFISHQHENTFLDTKKILGEWCSNVKYIKINEFEYNRTQHMLNESMDSKMIITLGPNGARHRDKTYPVPKVEIKDTSGAGDTFIAALVLKYAETKDIDKSIEFANHNATIVVQKKGVAVV